jgi:Kef-type K+ transport system membrane component KefB
MTLLLVQMAIILLATLICGWLARRCGQSRVIGEIVGGIVLGPSLLGHFWPSASNILFPATSLHSLETLANVGLILYLFLVGMELNTSHLRRQKSTALAASFTSILVPFIAAALLAHPLRIRFSSHGIGKLPFVLFLGISMSITAFPVLARILEERDLSNTPLGATAILCAAFDDVVAWLLLAVTLAVVNRDAASTSLGMRFVGLGAYLLLMFGIVRPLSGWIASRYGRAELSYEILALSLACLLLSAAATEWAGVHPLFGAFVAGVCFPRIEAWQIAARVRIEMLTSALVLPLFFALTGLKTRLDLLNGAGIWLWAAVVLIGAVGGKIGGAVLAARWSGQDWRAALALGALLNTRGLVELVVLNIAYSVGAFSPMLFTMLVLMALLTTMCTTPILNALKVSGQTERAFSAM